MAPWAKESPLPVCLFVYVVLFVFLLEHGHFYLFMCMCGCFRTTAVELNYFSKTTELKIFIWSFTEKVC